MCAKPLHRVLFWLFKHSTVITVVRAARLCQQRPQCLLVLGQALMDSESQHIRWQNIMSNWSQKDLCSMLPARRRRLPERVSVLSEDLDRLISVGSVVWDFVSWFKDSFQLRLENLILVMVLQSNTSFGATPTPGEYQKLSPAMWCDSGCALKWRYRSELLLCDEL